MPILLKLFQKVAEEGTLSDPGPEQRARLPSGWDPGPPGMDWQSGPEYGGRVGTLEEPGPPSSSPGAS